MLLTARVRSENVGVGSAKAPRCCGRGSWQGCSESWKTGSEKGKEGVLVRGVKVCNV